MDGWQWYYFRTGNSFTTPVISQTTTYYVQASDNGCTSDIISVDATVQIINDPVVQGDMIVIQAGDLTATGTGTLTWTDGNGNVLGTGNFTTPVISQTTSYYVQASDNGCTSAMISVDATVQIINNPTVIGDTICNSGIATLTASGSGDLTWTDGNGNILGTGNTLPLLQFQAPLLILYNFENGVQVTDFSGCCCRALS